MLRGPKIQCQFLIYLLSTLYVSFALATVRFLNRRCTIMDTNIFISLCVNPEIVKRLVLSFLLCLTLMEYSYGQTQSHTGKGFDYASALAPLRQTIAKSTPGKPDTNTLDAYYQVADIFNIRSRSSGDSHNAVWIRLQSAIRSVADRRQPPTGTSRL